ncbi:MAG: hypothetical protein P1U85_07020 [Verrucomicrobiales bacterium]|jgi:hypothetical protein|nr:hypothetical protein [Verrucomicrobiales bacterium]
MTPSWKATIIEWTEHPKARERKIDASFFPPVPESDLTQWEDRNEVQVPDEIRGYLLQSNGLEAQKGEIWPVLPLGDWEPIENECSHPDPWIRFGETQDFLYLLSLGHSPSIYRYARFGSDEEFFAPSFSQYLQKIFRGEG